MAEHERRSPDVPVVEWGSTGNPAMERHECYYESPMEAQATRVIESNGADGSPDHTLGEGITMPRVRGTRWMDRSMVMNVMALSEIHSPMWAHSPRRLHDSGRDGGVSHSHAA